MPNSPDYKLVNSRIVQRVSDGAFIPVDDATPAYRKYRQWLADGNTPAPADVPAPQRSLTVADKLAAMGISIDELRDALGIKH